MTAGVMGQGDGDLRTLMVLRGVLAHEFGLVGLDGVVSGICGASLGSATAL